MNVPPRRRWLRRILRVIAAAALLLAVAALTAGYTGMPWIDRWARARLRSELGLILGRPVTIGSIHVSPLAASLTARDIVVREGPSGSRTVLELPGLSAKLLLRPLLEGRIEIASLHLEGPRVNFYREGDRIVGPIPARQPADALPPRSIPGSGIKIVLRRIEIIDGVVMFEDRSVPLAGWAEGLLVQWDGDRSGGGRGTIQTQRAGFRFIDIQDLGRLRAEGRLEEGRIDGQARAEWGKSSFLSADVSAVLPARTGEVVTGAIKADCHLEEGELGRWLANAAGIQKPLAGIVDGSGVAKLDASGWSFDGRIRGSGLRFDEFSASLLTTDIRAGKDGIEILSLDLDLLGGRLSGKGRIEPRKGGAFELAARADGLDLNQTLTAIGLDSTLEGAGAVEGTAFVRIGDPRSLRVKADVTVSGLRHGAAGGVQPSATAAPGGHQGGRRAREFLTEGAGLLEIEGARVRFSSGTLHAGATNAAITIVKVLEDPELTLSVEGESDSLADTSDLVESFLLVETESKGLPWSSAKLAGTGMFHGQFLFRKGQPATGEVDYTLRNFAYEGIGAEEIRGTGRADGSNFSFVVDEARKKGGTVRLAGTFPEEREGLSRITGTLSAWPLDDVLTRIQAPSGSTVLGSGPIEFRFGEGEPSGETDLALTGAQLGGERFESGRFRAAILGTLLGVEQFDLLGEHASAASSGSYEISEGRLTGHLDASHVDIAIARPWLKDLPLTGHASVRLRAEAGAEGISWSGNVTPEEDLAFEGRPLMSLALSAEGDAKIARFDGSLGEQARFSGTVELDAPHSGEGRIDLSGVAIDQLLALARPDLALEVFGELEGRITWSGPLDDLRKLRAEAELSKLRLGLGGESFEEEGPTRLALEEGAVRILDARLRADGSQFRISGLYPIDEARSLDLEVGGSVDLGDLAAFIPELRAAGTLRASIHASGPREQPLLTGNIEIENGRMRLIGFPLHAERIALRARLEPGALVSDSITGWLAGGWFTGKGRVDLGGLEPTGFRLEGRVRNAILAYPDGFSGEYSGELLWQQKKGERSTLTGDLSVIRGLWRKDFKLDRISFGNRVRAPIAQVGALDTGVKRTELNISIRADDNVWCRNDLADVEGSANLRVGGTIGTPLVTGRFEAFPGGEMRFSQLRYQIEQAVVSFPDGPAFSVEYDVTATTKIRDYDIQMHLSGNFDHVDYDLTSSPPLQQKQILSLLLTGADPYEQGAGLTPTVPGQAGSTSAVEGALGSIAGSSLQRVLNVEELRIEPVPVDSSSASAASPTAARVTIGKRISTRVFVRTAVALNSPQNPIYQVEYLLTRHLQIILEQGETGALGGDLKYSTRFFGPGGSGESARSEAAPAKSTEKRKVGAVQFSGDSGTDHEALQRVTKIREGQTFSRRAMVDGADRLRARYVKAGYLEASVFPTMKPAGERADVTFAIEMGPRIEVRIEGAGSSESMLRKALKSLWTETRFSGELSTEGEATIRKILQDQGYYACYVRTITSEEGDTRMVTFEVNRGEKVIPEQVRIEGAKGISDTEIRRQVLTGTAGTLGKKPLTPQVLEEDVAAIENLYRAGGYLQAHVRPEVSLSQDGSRALVVLVVEEGRISRVKKVEITGSTSYGEERLQGLLASREGEPYLPVRVEADRDAIQKWYDARGYPEARVEAESAVDGRAVEVTFRVIEGERRTVGSVEISGNTVTSTARIERMVSFKAGDPVSAAAIQQTRQNLLKTGFFSDVQISYAQAQDNSEGQVLKIQVRDAPNLVVRLGAGYDNQNGPRGSVVFADTNLFGSGRYADISGVYGSKLQRAQIRFREPEPFGWLTSATLSPFYQNWVRESFTQLQHGGFLAIEKKMEAPVVHYLTYTNQYTKVYDLTVPPDVFRAANPTIDLNPLRLADLGYALVRDNRKPFLSAKSGTYSSVLVRGFSQALGSEQNFLKLFLMGSYYHPLPWSLNWASGMRVGFAWRGSQGQALPLQERYFSGGDSTVRGFGQDLLGYVQVDGDGNNIGTLEQGTLQPLGGEGLMIVNNELRKGIYGDLSGKIFLDFGNVYPRPTQILQVVPRFTAGAGLQYDTPIGPIRLEYGRKLNREPGEPSGAVFLSIGQPF